jgi:hypothetical protein
MIVYDEVRDVCDNLRSSLNKGEGAQLDLGETLLVFRLLNDKILPMEQTK